MASGTSSNSKIFVMRTSSCIAPPDRARRQRSGARADHEQTACPRDRDPGLPSCLRFGHPSKRPKTRAAGRLQRDRERYHDTEARVATRPGTGRSSSWPAASCSTCPGRAAGRRRCRGRRRAPSPPASSSTTAQRTSQWLAELCLMTLLTASRRIRVSCMKTRAGRVCERLVRGGPRRASILACVSRAMISARQSASASSRRTGLPARPRTESRISSSASRASCGMRAPSLV